MERNKEIGNENSENEFKDIGTGALFLVDKYD
jgi:hypothetical protein